MEKKNSPKDDELQNETMYEEPPIEDFLFNEDETEQEANKKRTTSLFGKMVALVLVISLLTSGLAVFIQVFNLPSFSFLDKSNELSKIENIQNYKEAVVTIEGGNSKGTGFNISVDGLIITNYHVIEHMPAIKIYFPSGEFFQAKAKEAFPDLDIAILEIDGKNLPHLELQSEKTWNVNDHIYVIGNPLAYNQIVMEGKIAGLTNTIQLTAPIHKGNSGSPVIDRNGKVIGVVYAKTIPPVGKADESVGLAVPIDEIINLVPR